MENIKNFYSGYGDMPPWGDGPKQHKIEKEGRKYIEDNFPLLDKFLRCTVHNVNENPKSDVAGASEFFSKETDFKTKVNTGSETKHKLLQREVPNLSGRNSAYQDHHQTFQVSQGSDTITVVVAGFFCSSRCHFNCRCQQLKT
mmetsp:Transcript_14035/g.41106  ORF Transcript_14035/g.41106 Transcript_14035/m.41106 type:complete len:143 (-) Transcript_14035:50-478(-)